jgi:hypothetical protein
VNLIVIVIFFLEAGIIELFPCTSAACFHVLLAGKFMAALVRRTASPKGSAHLFLAGILLCATPCHINHQHGSTPCIIGRGFQRVNALLGYLPASPKGWRVLRSAARFSLIALLV